MAPLDEAGERATPGFVSTASRSHDCPIKRTIIPLPDVNLGRLPATHRQPPIGELMDVDTMSKAEDDLIQQVICYIK